MAVNSFLMWPFIVFVLFRHLISLQEGGEGANKKIYFFWGYVLNSDPHTPPSSIFCSSKNASYLMFLSIIRAGMLWKAPMRDRSAPFRFLLIWIFSHWELHSIWYFNSRWIQCVRALSQWRWNEVRIKANAKVEGWANASNFPDKQVTKLILKCCKHHF